MLRICSGLAVALTLFTGCGSGIKLVPVAGTVTIDGRPLAYKTLMFMPEPGTPGHGGGANTGSDGTYSLIASIPGGTTDERGVPPGRYRVIVFEPAIPITQALETQTEEGGEPAPAIGPDFARRKTEIPAAYGAAETTPLLLEVPVSGGVFDVKLSSKPDR
jgi:hypothetical protein